MRWLGAAWWLMACGDTGSSKDSTAGTSPKGSTSSGSPATSGADLAPEPDAFGGFTLTLAEDGGVTNVWDFATTGAAGDATLQGVGDFPYTYEKTGSNTSELTFDVGGSDVYDMTWTSSLGGTFVESFDGAPGVDGDFTVAP